MEGNVGVRCREVGPDEDAIVLEVVGNVLEREVVGLEDSFRRTRVRTSRPGMAAVWPR